VAGDRPLLARLAHLDVHLHLGGRGRGRFLLLVFRLLPRLGGFLLGLRALLVDPLLELGEVVTVQVFFFGSSS